MIDRLATLIVDEGKWLPVSMGLALLTLAILLHRHRDSDLPVRHRVVAGMNLFFGVTIGTMSFGHLLAVTTKLSLGTLNGSVPFLYAIGILLAAPSWSMVRHARNLFASTEDHGKRTLWLNGWLAVTLIALGLPNLPLTLPAFFNIAYQLHSRRAVGWGIVGAAVALNLGLFIGALIFMASGQSFEQFSGMQ